MKRDICAMAETWILYRRIKNTKPKWDGWRNATDEEKLLYNVDELQ